MKCLHLVHAANSVTSLPLSLLSITIHDGRKKFCLETSQNFQICSSVALELEYTIIVPKNLLQHPRSTIVRKPSKTLFFRHSFCLQLSIYIFFLTKPSSCLKNLYVKVYNLNRNNLNRYKNLPKH